MFVLDKPNKPLFIVPMKLSAYLGDQKLTNNEFGVMVGATSEAVRLWARGDRIPSREFMDKIKTTTRGLVEPNDFFEAA